MDKWRKLRQLVPIFCNHKSMKMCALEAEKNARLNQVVDVELEGVVSLKRIISLGVAVDEEKFKGKGIKFEGKLCLSETNEDINKRLTVAQEAMKRVNERFQEFEASIEDGLRGLVGPNNTCTTQVELADMHDVFLINWMKKLQGQMEFKIGSEATDKDLDTMRDYMILNAFIDDDQLLQRGVVFKLNKNGKVSRVQ